MTTAPPAPPPALTAADAVALREQLRDQGWEPVETATDFRRVVVGAERVGDVRTIAYFPVFKQLLGGAMGWSHAGRVAPPPEAVFVETYEVEISGTAGRWTPVG